MEPALIPTPLLRSTDIPWPSATGLGEDAELGGDFYDIVESPDGTVTVLIGDVAGHGVDAAALAWLRLRGVTLALAGLPRTRCSCTSTSSCAEVEALAVRHGRSARGPRRPCDRPA